MKITRTSQLTDITRTLDIDITQAQLDLYYEGETLLQDAFPSTNRAEREFIKSGITPQEWETFFGQLLED